MGCNQSKATNTKSSEPVVAKQSQPAVAEVAAIAAVVTVAPPAPEAQQTTHTETPIVAKPVEQAPVVEAAPQEAVVETSPAAEVPATPAIVAPIVAVTPTTPVKKTAKKNHKKQRAAAAPASAPVAEAFSRTTPVAFIGEQENSAVSPKRSALKSAAVPSNTFGLSTKVNANVTSPNRACDADADKKAVHFAAEPAKPQHQDKVTQIVNKLKGKGSRNGLNKGNVREDVLQAQISAFERLLTDASTLTRQMDSR